MKYRSRLCVEVAAVLLASIIVMSAAAADVGSAQATGTPTIRWQQLLGGIDDDTAKSVQQTADGGYILLGDSKSNMSGNAAGMNHGSIDLWVVKLDGAGAIQWEKLLGGSEDESPSAIQQTADGGYILLGSTESSASGDITEANHGDPLHPNDLWLVKLTGSGTIQWQRLLGGSRDDYGGSVRQTTDGGYILVGESFSNLSYDVSGTNNGYTDLWVVKLDVAGAIQWQRLLGGSGVDGGRSVQETADGGYIILGDSWSSASGDVTGTNHGNSDLWVVKLDGEGTIQWQRLLGGADLDPGSSVQQTRDGGFVILGFSLSSASGDVTGTNHGGFDYWVVKLDGEGTIQWQRLLGGSADDRGFSISQAVDGGYLLAGDSGSSANGNVTGTNHGNSDLWVVRLDGAGTETWQGLLGGNDWEWGGCLQQTTDGGSVLIGSSMSSANGTVTGTNHGNSDIWVVKLDPEAPPVSLVPGGTAQPTDIDGDGKYDDVNGNNRMDFGDVILYFNQMAWIAANEPLAAFDYNNNRRVDFADVVWLFNHL